ncbi:hypothetical protein LguiA_035436 [Lonicera macranthoides]
MGRLLSALVFLFVLICYVPSLEARKVLSIEKGKVSSLVPSSHLKGTTIPTGKAHAMAINERLFTLHLAKMDRILQSVPSPGAGH